MNFGKIQNHCHVGLHRDLEESNNFGKGSSMLDSMRN